MRSLTKMIASLAASAALVASSTAAVAAAPAVPIPAVQPQAPNAWMMLSVLSPSGSVALGGANAAAAQPEPVPPPPAYAAGPALSGEVLPFVLWFGLIAVALTIRGSSGAPNSPP